MEAKLKTCSETHCHLVVLVDVKKATTFDETYEMKKATAFEETHDVKKTTNLDETRELIKEKKK